MNLSLHIIAGAIIAASARNASEVLLGALIWPAIYCAYATLIERAALREGVAKLRERGKPSPLATYYSTIGSGALLAALAVASAGFALRQWLN